MNNLQQKSENFNKVFFSHKLDVHSTYSGQTPLYNTDSSLEWTLTNNPSNSLVLFSQFLEGMPGSLYVSRKLPTDPSPKATFCPK